MANFPSLCFREWRWGEVTTGWRLLGFLQGWGAASRAGPGVGRPSELRMLAEESLNDGPGNLSWGGLEMKTEEAAGEEAWPSVLLSPEPVSHKGLRMGWRA